ncbi:MAG: hypothetical protein JWP89_7122 [Schlesneria sp.]|nr:hypothetical protein [Schlesneria sp.]
MIRRLAYVLLSYATRPLVWPLAAIYLVVLGISLWTAAEDFFTHRGHPLQTAYPVVDTTSHLLVLSDLKSLADFEKSGVDQNVTQVEIRWPAAEGLSDAAVRAALPFSLRHLQLLKIYPQLKSLSLFSCPPLHPDKIQAIGDLTRLESLQLIDCDVPAELWPQIGKLPRLRYLDISGSNLRGGYPELETVTQLETLILGSVIHRGFTEHDVPFLPQLKRFPRLKTVVIQNYSSTVKSPNPNHVVAADAAKPANHNPLVENLDDIRLIPMLQTLYVNDQLGGGPGFTVLQQKLPAVRVRPAYIDVERMYWFLVLLFLNNVILMLIGLQLQSQFSQSFSRLIPNYAAPHVIPVVCLWLFCIVLHSIPLWVAGVSVSAAIALNLLCWSISCGFGAFGTAMSLENSRAKTLIKPLAIAAAAWGPLAIVAVRWNTSAIDWYLRGYEPYFTWFLIVSGIVISTMALRQSLRLNATCLERGVSSPPISLDPVAMSAWQQSIYPQKAGGQRGWFSWLTTSDVDRLIARPPQTGIVWRSRLWIAGNPVTGNVMFQVALGTAALIGITHRLNTSRSEEWFSFQNPAMLMSSFLFPDMSVIVAASVWRSRRKLFAAESLRPLSRTEFARQIAQAIAWDLVPLALIYLTVLIGYVIASNPERWSWSWTIGMVLVFGARWLAVFGLLLWTIAIRRDWVMILAVFVAAYGLIFANIGIIFVQARVFDVRSLPSDLPDVGVPGLFLCAALLGLAASVITHFGYRRWQSIELI